MKCSCLDIGSNTIKISVFEKKGKHWTTTAFLGEQTGLIGYIEETDSYRNLSERGVEALLSALERLIAFSNEKEVEHLFAFATASLRGVNNIEAIQKAVWDRFGITIDVLSGEEEALCSLKGLLSDELCDGIREGIMIDMGGGSCEVVHFVNGSSPTITSLPFGCLSLTNEFMSFPPTINQVHKAREHVSACLKSCEFAHNLKCPVFLIGGTARAVEKLALDLKPRNNKSLTLTDFEFIVTKMCEDENFRNVAKRLIPKRQHTVTAGASAYFELLKYISPSKIFVSGSGVREGYLERILL